jgi:RNA polymerase-binding transcription factor DksA
MAPRRDRKSGRASGRARSQSDREGARARRTAGVADEADPRRRLEAEFAAVRARLRALGGEDLAEAVDPTGANAALDEEDVTQVAQVQEMGLETRQRLTDRLRRLDAALERADRGAYGRCVDCGRPIVPARLRAVPEVETCVECQERRERESAGAGEE